MPASMRIAKRGSRSISPTTAALPMDSTSESVSACAFTM
jgi:hypothetical protein